MDQSGRLDADGGVVEGRVLALWIQSGRKDVLRGASRALGADHWRPPRRVSGRGQDVWNSATVAWGRGGTTVAWRGRGPNGVTGVWTRELRAEGGWGPVRRVVRTGRDGVNRIDLALDRNSAGTAVAWVRRGNVRIGWRPAGGTWRVSRPVPLENGSPLAVSVDSAGHVDATVWSKGAAFAVRMRGNGTWRTPVRIGPEPGVSARVYRFAVESNGAGDLAVAWRQQSEGTAQSVVAVRPAGQAWEPDHILADSRKGVAIDVSARGVVSAAWIAPGSAELRLQRRGADGTWGASQALHSFPNGVTDYVAVDANRPGDAVVAFHAQPCSGDDPCPEWTVVRCMAGDGCEPARELAPPVWWNHPQVRIGPHGGAYAVWGAGCHTEACFHTSVRSRVLPPPAP